MGDLTRNFNKNEFSCPCGCGKDDISQSLVELLQMIRDEINIPIKINSGIRCEKHNKDIGGEKNSAHVKGRAADIACYASRTRYKILNSAVRRFDRIGIAKTFIHLDIDSDLPRKVIWTY